MQYQDIIRNEHFNNLAAIIRVPFHSKAWKDQHVHTPFWTLEKAFSEAMFVDSDWNRSDVLSRFVTLLAALVEADPRLRYTAADLDWFMVTLDSPEAKTTLSLFCAWYSAPDHYLTPAEVAAATGQAESTWRNRAAAGEIPGAVKKSKLWLLPRSVLRAQGFPV